MRIIIVCFFIYVLYFIIHLFLNDKTINTYYVPLCDDSDYKKPVQYASECKFKDIFYIEYTLKVDFSKQRVIRKYPIDNLAINNNCIVFNSDNWDCNAKNNSFSSVSVKDGILYIRFSDGYFTTSNPKFEYWIYWIKNFTF